MSLSHSLSNAISGMSAASRLAEIVSSNVANAMTDGYGRRTLDLSAASVGGRGAGVEIGNVNRIVDRGILADRRLADADLSQFNTIVSFHSRVEDAFGAAGAGDSLSGRIAALEQALVDASSDPSSNIRLGAVQNRMADLASSINGAADQVQALRGEADADIASQVANLNTALLQVQKLNTDITAFRNSGGDPSALLDQRQTAIDRIAAIVPVRELDRQGGQIALMTPSGEMLLDGRAKQFGFEPSPIITADMTLLGGGLSGVTLDGTPLSTDGIGKLAGGALGASFELRDQVLVNSQDNLDQLAANLIERTQSSSVDPTLTSGEAGLFTDAGGPLDPLDTVGLASRLSVNQSIDPDSGGDLWKIREGLNASTSGEAGNASNLQALSEALSEPRAMAFGGAVRSLAGHAADIQSAEGSARLEAETSLSFANARWSSLKEAEAAEGVDTDYEMQMLLRVEQSYAANARLVQTVESMLSKLMEL